MSALSSANMMFALYALSLYTLSYSMALSQDGRYEFKEPSKYYNQQRQRQLRSNGEFENYINRAVRYKRSLYNMSSNNDNHNIYNINNNNNNDNNNSNNPDEYESMSSLMPDFTDSYNENENDLLKSGLNAMQDSNNESIITHPILLYLYLMEQLKQKMPRKQNDGQLPARRTPRLGRSTNYKYLYNGNNVAAVNADLAQYVCDIINDDNNDNNNNNNNNNNIDYNLDHFLWPRIIKKSMPFKPRLGKREQFYAKNWQLL